MDEKVLIVKKKDDKISAKVRRRVHNGYAPDDYNNVLNPMDANALSLFFEDLELLLNSPIEKAFRKFKERKGESNPFF